MFYSFVYHRCAKTCLSLLLCLVGTSGISPIATAAEFRVFEGSGHVEVGPCAQADVFVTDKGERYELDRSRIQLPKNKPLHVVGKTFPHISVCKRFAWLDVSRSEDEADVTIQKAMVNAPLMTSVVQGTATTIEHNSVLLTIRPEELASTAPFLGFLAYKKEISHIYLHVNEGGDFSRFSILLSRLGIEAPEVMAKVAVQIGTFKTPLFLRDAQGKVTTYSTLNDLKSSTGAKS